MRLLIAIFALALWWAPAQAAITLISHGNNSLAAGGTSVAVTLAGTGAGRLIVVGVGWCGDGSCGTVAGTVSSVTSSNSGSGETCSHATNSAGSSTNGQLSDIWYCPNIVGGSDTITVNFSTTVSFAFVAASEWSGAATSSVDDGVGNGGGSTAATSLSVATNGNTTVTGDLIFGVVTPSGASVAPAQTAINTVSSPSNWGQVDSYQIAGAPGSYSNSWTQSSGKISGSVAAFKPAVVTGARNFMLIGAGK